jgi:hypothetical protein
MILLALDECGSLRCLYRCVLTRSLGGAGMILKARVCTTSGEGLRIHATLSKGLREPLQKVRRGFFCV